MSSYQRLIIHRVAQYFHLDHTPVEIEQKRAVLVTKNPASRMYISLTHSQSLTLSRASLTDSIAWLSA